MDIREILQCLPHRFPFVMVDRVLTCEPGKRLVAIKNVTYNEAHFAGHFPGDPVMPGVLIVEALAQAAAILATRSRAGGGFDPARQVVYFLGIDGMRFRRVVRPGDQLVLEVEPKRAGARIWKVHGRALVGDELAAEGDMLATFGERASSTS